MVLLLLMMMTVLEVVALGVLQIESGISGGCCQQQQQQQQKELDRWGIIAA
jgi:hypothetical protein